MHLFDNCSKHKKNKVLVFISIKYLFYLKFHKLISGFYSKFKLK